MLNNEKKQILDQIIAQFSKEEVLWTSSYLAGSASGSVVESQEKLTIQNLTILYVTETGNSKFLANEISKKLKAQNVVAKVKSVEQYRLNDFAKEKNLILISSTHGEGEIPAAGLKFHDHLTQNELDLSKLKFLVISLGDRNYPLFCEAGKIFETGLEELKAQKAADRIDLDLDFENFIPQIYATIQEVFGGVKSAQKIAPVASTKNEFEGEIVANVNLNDIGSSKEIHHIEIAVEDEDLHYEPGDSIGIKIGEGTPRLYSIASAKGEHGNEVHLTVSLLKYSNENGEEVEGLASGYLSHLAVGEKIKFYISRNRSFKLPADDKDVIMVGPGTGVAPFRGFLAERNSRLASGKNWLFFGERNFQTDFLYQTEFQDHLESGLLSRLDVAFSRDQKEKIYVQNRLEEKAKDLFNWLENGAYFYVCGDKENMAQDVENALLAVIEGQGKPAKEYLENLTKEGRYLRDVY